MDCTDEHIRWCWDNNWFVDVIPMEKQEGVMQPLVRLEVHNRTDKGTMCRQAGKEVFKQRTDKDKAAIMKEADRIYKLIYDKHNK